MKERKRESIISTFVSRPFSKPLQDYSFCMANLEQTGNIFIYFKWWLCNTKLFSFVCDVHNVHIVIYVNWNRNWQSRHHVTNDKKTRPKEEMESESGGCFSWKNENVKSFFSHSLFPILLNWRDEGAQLSILHSTIIIIYFQNCYFTWYTHTRTHTCAYPQRW